MKADYSQPEFYHFNEDSLKLVQWVLRRVASAQSILDLGAGSGVIGIELSRCLLPRKLTLLEVQDEYAAFLEQNIEDFLPPSVEPSVIIGSFSTFDTHEKFDLIVSNPPYYLPGKGLSSPDPNRAIARSFIIDSWKILLQKISRLLTKEGSCFMVLKMDESLFKSIEKEARSGGLALERNDSETLMFLLFRLNIK